MKDFVLLPRRAWKAFLRWYGRTSELQRTVISYDAQGSLSENKLIKVIGGRVYEVEMSEIIIMYGLVTENYKIFQSAQMHAANFSRKATLRHVL